MKMGVEKRKAFFYIRLDIECFDRPLKIKGNERK
mgnify:CR=1 FL=1